jgi:hypothetical protein
VLFKNSNVQIFPFTFFYQRTRLVRFLARLEAWDQNIPATYQSVMAVHVSNLRPAHEDGLTAGVIHDNGTLRTRLEIDEFIKRKEMANLYILALHDLQKVDTWKERFSYFQIAGE